MPHTEGMASTNMPRIAGRLSASGVRYEGPLDPPKGNCFVVRIRNGAKTLELNPCSHTIAMAYAKRWNEKTKTDSASVHWKPTCAGTAENDALHRSLGGCMHCNPKQTP